MCTLPTSTWKLSVEIQGNLGDRNRKCFGISNSQWPNLFFESSFDQIAHPKLEAGPVEWECRNSSQCIPGQCGAWGTRPGQWEGKERQGPWKALWEAEAWRALMMIPCFIVEDCVFQGKPCLWRPLCRSQTGSLGHCSEFQICSRTRPAAEPDLRSWVSGLLFPNLLLFKFS